MKLRKRIAVIAASAIMLTGTLPQTILTVCAEETQQTAAVMVATASVNVRAGDSASTKLLGSLTKGQPVTATGKTAKGWYIIDYNGQTGYVSGKYLTDNSTPTPASATPAAPVASNTDGQTKTFSDGTVYVSRGKTPGGLTMWYASTDNGTWPDYIIQAYDATGITDDMSDYDKAVAINNYICKVVDWDTSTGEVEDKAAYSACLFYGKAICTGYSQAFLMLCTIAGVGADRAGGLANGAAHEWNYVLIGDTKYWVDVYSNDKFESNDYLMKTTLFPGFEANY